MKSIRQFGFIVFFLGIGTLALTTNGTWGCGGNCGNGVVDSGETCDDGNKTDGDGCSSSCETESAGTTGGGTTGGGTTGGTECTTPADCADSFSAASVCDTPSTCQGHRVEATCTGGVCGSVSIPDDSACTAESFTRDCDGTPGDSCDGTVVQTEPNCPTEICDDGPVPPNVNDDDDGDGLINCADTVDCPNGTPCTHDNGYSAQCWGGICQD